MVLMVEGQEGAIDVSREGSKPGQPRQLIGRADARADCHLSVSLSPSFPHTHQVVPNFGPLRWQPTPFQMENIILVHGTPRLPGSHPTGCGSQTDGQIPLTTRGILPLYARVHVCVPCLHDLLEASATWELTVGVAEEPVDVYHLQATGPPVRAIKFDCGHPRVMQNL